MPVVNQSIQQVLETQAEWVRDLYALAQATVTKARESQLRALTTAKVTRGSAYDW
jgi:hypothetical protein